MRLLRLLLPALALLAAPLGFAAGAAPEPTIVVVGTSFRSPLDASDWAYLSWLASDPALLRDRSYAVYAKSGDADSANPYALVSVVGLQVDPATIGALFERSRHLGQDLAALGEAVGGYYRESNPSAGLGAAEMLSFLAATSYDDKNLFQMLTLMGRSHPGVALAIGTGFAAKLAPGQTTFELRECVTPGGNADANCTSVIGRVTVTANSAVKLTAPAAPLRVPDVGRDGVTAAPADIKGHLNVKLRWATPDALRRQSLLVRGYNVYRATRAYAEARGWDVCPASAALLALNWEAEVAAASPQVVRVNRGPIMMRRYYTTAEAADFDNDAGDGIKGDLEFYTQDDNRNNGLVFDNVGRPTDSRGVFVAGAEFYYYVVPVDLLGRNGTPSCGTLLKICDRDPPAAPKAVTVENDFTATGGGATTSQRFRISWDQVPESAGDNVVAYYVYRWRSLTDLKAMQNLDPATLGAEFVVAGPISHTAGKKARSVTDDASAMYSPKIGADPQFGAAGDDAGRTIWYTVRAVDASACGANFSPNSAPGFGVLRDRAAPVGGGGYLNIQCCAVGVKEGKQDFEQGPSSLDVNRVHFNLSVSRNGTNPAAIVLAEFFVKFAGNSTEYGLMQAEFPADPAVPLVVHPNMLLPGVDPGTLTLGLRVHLDDGKMSAPAYVALPTGPAPFVHTGTFVASRECDTATLNEGLRVRPFCSHAALDPVTGQVNPLYVLLEAAAGAREYRVYRTVDGGPLTLVRQGTYGAPATAGQQLLVVDTAFSPAGGLICYFVRYFDEHGNGGPLHDLGCTQTIGLPPPKPSLGRLQPITPGGVPKLRMKWFESPAGVERFEVAISHGGFPPASLSTALTPLTGQDGAALFDNGQDVYVLGRKYRTGVVGQNFTQTGPEFTVTLDEIDTSKTYWARVRAIGKNGLLSPWSNTVEFTWQMPEQYLAPEVAWPARPLPSETPAFAWDSRITAEFLHGRIPGFLRIGVRIGTAERVRSCFTNYETDPGNPVFSIGGDEAPETFLYPNAAAIPMPGVERPKLLPVMLYRYQVPNDMFPTVSGDIVQVTPLIESIAARRENPVSGLPAACDGWRIYDPYIAVSSGQDGTVDNPTQSELWLLDSHPIVFGARYRYLLVVFNEHGEVRTVIPTNEVDANY